MNKPNKYLLFTAPGCMPCRAAKDFLKQTPLEWSIVNFNMSPSMFEVYTIKATPTLVRLDNIPDSFHTTSRDLRFNIVATGLDTIIEYVNSLTYFDVSEPIRSEEE